MTAYTHADVDTLARTLWGECRGEPRLGKVAVAWVVRNRAEDARWPDSPAECCLQKWQFSCWNPGDPNLPLLMQATDATSGFRECMSIARGVLDGTIPDPTAGADHYFAKRMISAGAPNWYRPEAVTAFIGGHVFLRLSGSKKPAKASPVVPAAFAAEGAVPEPVFARHELPSVGALFAMLLATVQAWLADWRKGRA